MADEPQQPLAIRGREIRQVENDIALFDTAKFEHFNRIATGMALASLVPKHLKSEAQNYETYVKESAANCLMVINQAERWGIDPFACAAETYVIGGKLGYQGKLIAGIINTRSNVVGGLKSIFNNGKNDDLAIAVYGALRAIPREEFKETVLPLLQRLVQDDDKTTLAELDALDVLAVRLAVGQARTDNKMWKNDPEQKLVYSASIRWARRYRPEIILGVKIDDDIEREVELPKALTGGLVGSSTETPARTVSVEVLPAEKAKTTTTRTTKAKPTETPAQAPAQAPEAEKPKEEEKKAAPSVPPPPPADDFPGAEPEPEQQQQQPAPTKGKLAPMTEEEPAPGGDDTEDDGTASAENLIRKARAAGFNETHLRTMAIRMRLCEPVDSFKDIKPSKLQDIFDDWETALDAMASIKAKEAKK